MSTIHQSLAEKLQNKANQLNRANMKLLEWGMKYVPHYFDRKFSRVHHEIAARLDNLRFTRDQKEVYVVPRGYAKSTISSFLYPLKCICEGTERYIIIGSDTEGQAAKYLASIKAELEGNDLLKKDYPLACATSGDRTWNSERIETGNNCCVEVFGKGTGVRGRKFKQFRPSLIILDDPQSDEDVNSPTGRVKDIEWINRSLLPCGDKGTNIVFVGNDLHQESIIHCHMKKPSWHCIKYAAIEQWPNDMDLWDAWEQMYWSGDKVGCNKYYSEHSDAMNAGSVVLWPEKETLLDLMIHRADLGHPAFEAEKQNNPRDPSKCAFPEEWFSEDILYDEWPRAKQHITVGYNDPAKGVQNRKRDSSATVTLHFVPEEKCCYVECDIRQIPATFLTDSILDLHLLNHYVCFGIEDNGFQFLLGDELFNKAMARNIVLNVLPVEHYGVHKHRRIDTLSVWLQKKFFKFKRNCPYTKILIQQLMNHPFSEHDDGSDSLEGALRILTTVSALDNGATQTPFDDGLGDFLCFD